jgi:hypothetical protein
MTHLTRGAAAESKKVGLTSGPRIMFFMVELALFCTNSPKVTRRPTASPKTTNLRCFKS